MVIYDFDILVCGYLEIFDILIDNGVELFLVDSYNVYLIYYVV